MAESNGDKKHPASERRRQKAREEGQVVKSQDLTSAAMLMAAVIALAWLGRETVDKLAASLAQALSQGLTGPLTTDSANAILATTAWRFGWIVLPLLVVMFVAGIVINVSQ